MKLTLFSLPKAFRPPFDVIQENAVRSWCALRPAAEVILLGDEIGTAECAARNGARFEPEIARNDLGTPLVNSLFQRATQLTRTNYQGYINADIVLDPRLPELLEKVTAWRKRVLIVSRRWDIDVPEHVAMDGTKWFTPLAQRARADGQLYSHLGMDVFIFPTGMFDHMPAFSIGWPGAKYDNWLVYAARRLGVPVVDITDATTLVHQNHPTGVGGADHPAKAKEHWINLDLLGGHGCCFDLLDATHEVAADGTIRARGWNRERLQRTGFRFAQRCRYQWRRRVLGFSYTRRAGVG